MRTAFAHFCRLFRRNENGNVALTFALTMAPLIAITGFALDYANTSRLRNDLQNLADAAALAASSGDYAKATPEERIQRAKAFLEASLAARNLSGVSASVSFADNKISVSASAPNGSSFSKFTGLSPTVSSSSYATVSLATDTGIRVLDVAMCIDATGSMQKLINTVRDNASGFYDTLNAALAERGAAQYQQIRIRIIGFRDYSFDGAKSMVPFNFVTMPAQATTLDSNLGSLIAGGGGDAEESAHECWAIAMQSAWLKVGDKTADGKAITQASSLIILWTDNRPQTIPDRPRSFYEYGGYYGWYQTSRSGTNSYYYPPSTIMPRTETDFAAKWRNQAIIDQTNKMYVMFGPCQSDKFDRQSYENQGSWRFGMSLEKTSCAGSINDGIDSMVGKIADGMIAAASNTTVSPPRLTY